MLSCDLVHSSIRTRRQIPDTVNGLHDVVLICFVFFNYLQRDVFGLLLVFI